MPVHEVVYLSRIIQDGISMVLVETKVLRGYTGMLSKPQPPENCAEYNSHHWEFAQPPPLGF